MIPRTLAVKFDPKQHVVFGHQPDDIALILFCCIRHTHRTRDGFGAEVLHVADVLRRKRPRKYKQFRDIIGASPLLVYGSTPGRPITMTGTHGKEVIVPRKIDDNFWEDVWRFISGKDKLELRILRG